ncbi:MAG: DUF2971 domain-containing protein [Eubacteriales bacterium]|nr:DUF2971 domain-containing protein [Eubacteriales bacterium]
MDKFFTRSDLYNNCTQNLIERISIDDIIYHYTSPVGIERILGNNTIRFSDSAFVNDSSETRYIYEVVLDVIGDHSYQQTLEFDLWETLSHLAISVLSDEQAKDDTEPTSLRYLCCFSQNPDSLSLWNYYTKTSTGIGFNIGYSFVGLVNALLSLDDFDLSTGKIVYKPDEQQSILRAVISSYNDKFKNESDKEAQNIILNELEDCLYYLAAFIKHPAFFAEEEVRIVLSTPYKAGQKRNAKYYEKSGIMVPYIPVFFDKSAVKAIGVSPVRQSSLIFDGLSCMLADSDYCATILPSHIPFRD